MNLSEKIVTLRKRQGMSQEDLAEKLDVSRQTISRWENGTVVPDAYNILEISKAFGVTSDYLLNDEFETDDDLPQIKEVKKDNHILHSNLTKIAIIAQVSFLNAAMKPYGATNNKELILELIIKLVPLLLASAWMVYNWQYEKDPKQYKQNVLIELAYCGIQSAIFLFGYFSKMYYVGTPLLIVLALIYLLFINPKYMNRPFIKEKTDTAPYDRKTIFNVSLCKNGILGGLLYVEDTELIYCTNKLTVSEKIRRLHMPYNRIQKIEKAPLHTVVISLKNGEEYRFLVFSREKFMEKAGGHISKK